MGYSENPEDVRVDFFKPSGKHYTTESFKWVQYESTSEGKIILIHDYFRDMLVKDLKERNNHIRLAGMWAVCLKPYHEYGCPLMIHVPGCYGCGLLVCETVKICRSALEDVV